MTAPRCLVLGGTGSLAGAAEDLVRSGARVTVTCRDPARAPRVWQDLGIEVLALERDDSAGIEAFLGHDGVTTLVDGQCYSPAQAADLARWSHAADSTVMLSARAVYRDADGRHVNSPQSPGWSGPTSEDTPTLSFHGEDPMTAEGYGANKAEAERVLAAQGRAVSVLRPARIHGRDTRQVREWPVIRAVLDGARELAVEDAGVTGSITSTTTLARAVLACHLHPGHRAVNCADGPALSNHEVVEHLLRGLDTGAVSGTPEVTTSSVSSTMPTGDPAPTVIPGVWVDGQELDLSALAALIGDVPAPEATLPATARWLADRARRTPDGTWALTPAP